MNNMNKLVALFRSNRKALLLVLIDKLSFLFSDETYLRIQFKLRMGYPLNLDNPVTFSEKLQWLKLNDRNSLYTKLVDKYDVKTFVITTIGAQYIIPTIGVWDTVDSIQWESLPQQFVLKTTQGGGSYGVIVCKDKSSLDKSLAIKRLNKALKQDIYKTFREWPYKNVRGRIIAEEYMEQEDGSALIDYKFFCFNGEPQFLYVRWEDSTDRKEHINFITLDWEPTHFYRPDCRPSIYLPHKPTKFEDMKELTRKLSKGIPFVRVDLYEINSKVYFSELTFYPSSGLLPFEPGEWDRKIGDMLILPQKREKQ